jgi:biopolymer transport protein ExbD
VRRNRRSAGNGHFLDLTSCSDIIFTLLLFYILTQNYVTRFPVELPSLASATDARPISQSLELDASGTLRLGMTVLDGPEWAAEVCRQIGSGPLNLFADRRAPVGRAVEVLDQLRVSGVTSVALIGRPLADTISPDVSPTISGH